MNLRNKFKDQTGFTIIEVMIVLAIAAVIMLIVFLAVPALQRNSRNTQRADDAARIASAVNQCLANRNGQTDRCDDETEIAFSANTEASQLTQPISFSRTGTAPTPSSGTDRASVWYNRSCTPAGDTSQGGSSTKQFVVLWTNEVSVTRCFGS